MRRNEAHLESAEINSVAALARDAAFAIQEQYRHICENMPVRATKIARMLGYKIKKTSAIPRARLEYSLNKADGGLFGEPTITISLNTGMQSEIGRFAVAHEIGHAVLLSRYPAEAANWRVGLRELFADEFASELLVPRIARGALCEQFINLATPSELSQFASKVGVSLHSILTFSSKHGPWFKDNNTIWLRVKHIENKYTNKDPKLRIVSAHFDRNRFYVASNQGFSRFCTTNGWLGGLELGEQVNIDNAEITIKRISTNDSVKYKTQNIVATLHAMRLSPSGHDNAPYFLISAELKL